MACFFGLIISLLRIRIVYGYLLAICFTIMAFLAAYENIGPY